MFTHLNVIPFPLPTPMVEVEGVGKFPGRIAAGEFAVPITRFDPSFLPSKAALLGLFLYSHRGWVELVDEPVADQRQFPLDLLHVYERRSGEVFGPLHTVSNFFRPFHFITPAQKKTDDFFQFWMDSIHRNFSCHSRRPFDEYKRIAELTISGALTPLARIIADGVFPAEADYIGKYSTGGIKCSRVKLLCDMFRHVVLNPRARLSLVERFDLLYGMAMVVFHSDRTNELAHHYIRACLDVRDPNTDNYPGQPTLRERKAIQMDAYHAFKMSLFHPSDEEDALTAPLATWMEEVLERNVA